MDMIKVKEIHEVYTRKAKEENYDNNETLDIVIAANDAIQAESLVGTEADTLTWGEFTRRFEKAMKELEALIGN